MMPVSADGFIMGPGRKPDDTVSGRVILMVDSAPAVNGLAPAATVVIVAGCGTDHDLGGAEAHSPAELVRAPYLEATP